MLEKMFLLLSMPNLFLAKDKAFNILDKIKKKISAFSIGMPMTKKG
jgi:hypothetical protein